MDLPVTLSGWIGLALIALITSLTALGFRGTMDYVKVNIQHAAFDALRKWAGTYVAALAQDPSLKGLASEEKKERAMLWVVIKAAELGIPISPTEASQMIEQAVWLLKNSTLPAAADALSA